MFFAISRIRTLLEKARVRLAQGHIEEGQAARRDEFLGLSSRL
jgi:hypothetical protein